MEKATMRQIVLGLGEVGTALIKILENVDGLDSRIVDGPKATGKYEVIHICFPYSPKFEVEVREYKKRFKADLTIIHSSVPVGTSDKLGAVYSPVRGVHPNLEQGIRTFAKYFAGPKAYEAAALFSEKGIFARVVADTRTIEAAKLWDTTAYGVMILLEKEIWTYCRNNGLDFEIVYREFTSSYNSGYMKLGMNHVVRPWLMHKEGKIGGHCVLENAALLNSPSARRIIAENKKL